MEEIRAEDFIDRQVIRGGIILRTSTIMNVIFILANVVLSANVSLIYWLVSGLSIISNISTSAILIFSASVNEFIYKQAN